MTSFVRPGLFAFFFFTQVFSCITAQTVLQPGDLAVVGVNANLAGCGAEGDLISFVCFRDIEPNTLIDLTDNGWERANPGQWGNSEGFVTMRRTGGIIPAGTVVTIRLPQVAADGYAAVGPDGDWEFTQLSFATVNLNAGGDQLYFLQGGEWERGDDAIGSAQHNALYTGGAVLYGFNTKAAWNGFSDDSGDSGLHPDVEPCFLLTPTAAADFLSYTGPLDPTWQLAWIERLGDPGNWQGYAECLAYPVPPARLGLETEVIALNCTACGGCDTLQETLVFTLPPTGGPFTVVYSDGTNEYTATGLNDGDSDVVEITKTVTLEIVSVTGGTGCPVYSNFGTAPTVAIEARPPAAGALASACAVAPGEGVFNLRSAEGAVNLSTGVPVNWYADAALSRPIADPAAYRSGPGLIYATVGTGSCISDPVPVELTLLNSPAVSAAVERTVECVGEATGAVRLSIDGGTPPYRIDWSDDAYDNQAAPTGLAAGNYRVTVSDAAGCRDSTQVSLTAPAPLELQCAEETPVSNLGASDGSASITFNGGTAPYRLDWQGPGNGTQTVDAAGTAVIEGLASGAYSVTVRDQNGCNQSCTFSITDADCTLSLRLEKQNVSCAGFNDGAVTLNLEGGAAPYTINWDADRFDGLLQLNDLPVGAYSVVVTDAAGCSSSGTASVVADHPAIDIDITPGGPACRGDCYGFSLTLAGSAPFQLGYRLRAPGLEETGTFTTDQVTDFIEFCPDLLGVTSGEIEVFFESLTDAHCTRTLDQREVITLLEESVATLDTLLCAGDSLLVNGVTYNAANPSGTEVLSGSAANGCDSTVIINLSYAPPATRRIARTLCEGESITVNGTLYDEGNPTGTEILKNAAPSGCDSILIVELTYQRDTVIELRPALCRGQQLTVNGTVYDENNPGGTEVLQRTSGCDSTLVIELSFVDEVQTLLDETLCPGESITVNGTVYDENNPTGEELFPAGSAAGCDSVVVVNLTFSGGETLLAPTLCEGESITVNGTVYDQNNAVGREVIAGGSVAGCDSTVVIQLRFETAVTVQLDSTLCSGESLLVGQTVYDENNPSGTELLQRASGCDSTVVVNLSFVPGATAALEGGGRLCPGDSTTLTVRLTGAATATVQYSDGVLPPVRLENIGDGHTFRVAPAVTTTYGIDFVLINGATCPAGVGAPVTVEVSELSAAILPAADYGGYGVSCFGAADGALRVETDTGGTPVSIAWSTGATTPAISGLPAGNYGVTVADEAGCVVSDSIALTEPAAIQVLTSLLEPTCPGDTDGALIIESIDGGAPPYAYRLNNDGIGTVGDTPFFLRDIGAGDYELRVQDANGCAVADTFAVAPLADLQLSLGEDRLIARYDSVLLEATVNFSVDSLVWSPAGGLSDPAALTTVARPLASTTYKLTAYDPKGCSISDEIRITVEERSRLYAPNAFSPNQDGINDYFNLAARADDVAALTLRIFDRWGSLVYEREQLPADDTSDGWDGRIRGQPAHEGVYIFFADIRYTDGTEERVSGEVVLIR